VLAHDGIKFLDLHFLRLSFLVFGGGVKVAGFGTGDQFDFVTHEFDSLYFFAASADVVQYAVDAAFVDDPQTLGGYAQTNPTVFAFNPEAVMVQIGHKTATRFVVGVRYIIAGGWAFARDLAHFRHGG